MTHASSDEELADIEDSLGHLTLASWNRVRSSDELQGFIDRHHSAIATVEL